MKKVATIWLASCLLFSTHTSAQETWAEKPYTEWSREEAIRVITKSPWVKTVSVSALGPVVDQGESPSVIGGAIPTAAGGAPRPQREAEWPTINYPVEIIWAADPVRKAYFRLARLDGHREPVPPDNLGAVQFFIQGKVLVQMFKGDTEQMQGGTYLKKKSGERIPVAKVLVGKDFAKNPRITLLFPAQLNGRPILTPEDKDVQLVILIGNRKFTPKFKLKEMVVRGELMI